MSNTMGATPFTTVKVRAEVFAQLEARAEAESIPAPRVLAACVAYLAKEDPSTLTPPSSTYRPRNKAPLRRVAIRMSPTMLRARGELLKLYPSWSQAVEDAIVRNCERVILY